MKKRIIPLLALMLVMAILWLSSNPLEVMWDIVTTVEKR